MPWFKSRTPKAALIWICNNQQGFFLFICIIQQECCLLIWHSEKRSSRPWMLLSYDTGTWHQDDFIYFSLQAFIEHPLLPWFACWESWLKVLTWQTFFPIIHFRLLANENRYIDRPPQKPLMGIPCLKKKNMLCLAEKYLDH